MTELSLFKHLKRLSAVKSNKGVEFLTPAAAVGHHCPMHTALSLASQIKDLSSLVIGTQECTNYSRVIIEQPYGDNGELHWLYVLDANEVVFGCHDGLLDALKEMDQAGAKAILLIVTCIPELIGEDMDALVYELQPRLTARLVPILVGHFRCNSYPGGYLQTLEGIAKIMEPLPLAEKTINVLANTSNLQMMPSVLRILSELGFKIRIYGQNTALEDFLKAPEAVLNLVFSQFTVPMAKRMERELGTPYVCLHDVYGIVEIDAAYEEIGEKLAIDLLAAFAKEREELQLLEKEVEEELNGKSYIATQLFIDPIPLAAYFAKLGLEPLLLHLEEFYQEDKHWAKVVTANGYDPFVCSLVNTPADLPLLELLEADFCLGEGLRISKKNIPCLQGLHSMFDFVGYERTIVLLKELKKQIIATANNT